LGFQNAIGRVGEPVAPTKTGQSRQLDAMSWSWETSTTASGPAPTYSRGLNIDPRYVQHWKGPAARNWALGHPKPRLGSRRDRPPAGRDAWCDGKGPANAWCGVGDLEAEPGRRRARAGPVAGPVFRRRASRWPTGCERMTVFQWNGVFCAGKSTSLQSQELSTLHPRHFVARTSGRRRLPEPGAVSGKG